MTSGLQNCLDRKEYNHRQTKFGTFCGRCQLEISGAEGLALKASYGSGWTPGAATIEAAKVSGSCMAVARCDCIASSCTISRGMKETIAGNANSVLSNQ